MWKFEEEHPFAIAHRLVKEGKLDPWDVDICALLENRQEQLLHVSKFEDALEELKGILKDCKGNLSFSQLISGKSLVPYLMALMVLYQDGVVDI